MGDLSMVNWARAQFALTALYHWIFVPLTLGLSFLLAFFETIYVRTGKEEWLRITKFWMKLFAVNFAIGVATGIILEFEFGTNWSNYSWMVGDIFGAPLAIEGIFAFFLEATFFAVMFFGWNRVSKKVHLFSTWMVAIGSNLSALWILVANAWMQHPVGMRFNPALARFEMQNFSELVLSPVAVSKFTHATSSGFVLASLFVVSVSSWFLLQERHRAFARKSIAVASVFGLLSSAYLGITGDEAAYTNAQKQPMKLAAMEGLYQGTTRAGLVAIGLPNSMKIPGDNQKDFFVKIEVPGLLSLLANRELDSFVPGIDDLVWGNPEQGIMGVAEKMARGKAALSQLAAYKQAREQDPAAAERLLAEFRKNEPYLGYGYLERPADAVPPVAMTFWSFRVMAILGTLFPILFLAFLVQLLRGRLEGSRNLLHCGVAGVFLGWVATELGWVVAEVGRQPWAIQDLLPTWVARSNLTAGTVQTTFFLFLAVFTVLLFAEVRIMWHQIKQGPEEA